MKITQVACYFSSGIFYVRVDTEEGVSGYGECSRMNNEAVLALVRTVIAPAVIGMSVFDGERIEEKVMTRNYKISGQLLAMAYSGVEMAIWDAKAVYLGQPIYNLLGGSYRDRVDAYGSSLQRDLGIEEEAERLKEAAVTLKLRAVKIKTGPRMGRGPAELKRDAAKVKRVRKELGPDIELMVDGNSSYTYMQAVQLFHMIEDCRLYHYEEPCPYDDVEAYVKLANRLPVPIHVGEQDWNLYTFREFIARGACHYYAVDAVKCGGFANAMRATVLCKAFGIQYVPHNTSQGIGLAATLQLAATVPHFGGYVEYRILSEDHGSQYLADKLQLLDGGFRIPDGPGLGIRMDHERMDKELQQVVFRP
ncbi:mandelate racemase/muconate lactonizing enzyme family protein [Paenibacillus gansuensis]|uniref:Mandelate racemase/muconate lactonizing enzyme family protein n=1 Tax=Paenibacillus gansuensis TaxID=306542 RepID=A0ABW5P987_9BACL